MLALQRVDANECVQPAATRRERLLGLRAGQSCIPQTISLSPYPKAAKTGPKVLSIIESMSLAGFLEMRLEPAADKTGQTQREQW